MFSNTWNKCSNQNKPSSSYTVFKSIYFIIYLLSIYNLFITKYLFNIHCWNFTMVATYTIHHLVRLVKAWWTVLKDYISSLLFRTIPVVLMVLNAMLFLYSYNKSGKIVQRLSLNSMIKLSFFSFGSMYPLHIATILKIIIR